MAQYNSLSFPIVVLDDNELILELMSEVIGNDFRVFTTSSSEEFLDFVKNEEPAVAFVDYHLTHSTGLDLIKNITGSTKYIMISGDKSSSILERAIQEEKIVGYLGKPFEITKIRQLLTFHYQNYINEISDSLENSKLKLQAGRYKKEISELNEHLFDTMVSSYTNYKFIEKLGMYLDDMTKSVIEIAKKSNAPSEMKPTLQLYHGNIKRLLEYFNIDYLLILEAITEFLVKISILQQKSEPLSNELEKLSNYIENNIEVVPLIIKQQLKMFKELMNSDFDSGNLTPISVLNRIKELNLVLTLMIQSIDLSELPQPTVHYVVIIKNDLPIFKMSRISQNNDKLALMTNFITALRSFSDEMLSHGSIKAIQLQEGVILVIEKEEIIYFCLFDYETMYSRMILEQFVDETVSYITQKDGNIGLDDDNFILSKLENIIL